jgi:hypothetical protein
MFMNGNVSKELIKLKALERWENEGGRIYEPDNPVHGHRRAAAAVDRRTTKSILDDLNGTLQNDFERWPLPMPWTAGPL